MKGLPEPDYFEIQYLFTGGVCGFAAKVFLRGCILCLRTRAQNTTTQNIISQGSDLPNSCDFK